MKNILFVSTIVFFYGCAEMQSASKAEEKTLGRKMNEHCQKDIEEVEIFQVFENGALANVCEHGLRSCYGMVVAVPKEKGEELWDKKRVKAPEEKCIVINDTYKYISKDGANRTVPIIRYDYKYIPLDEKEAMERVEASFVTINEDCVSESMKDAKSDRVESKKACGCFVDSMKNLVVEMRSSSEYLDQDSFIQKWLIQAEKDCGKSPKNMKWFK